MLSWSAFSLPTITEVEGSIIVVSENVLQEPRSCKQADANLTEELTGSAKSGSDIVKILQQIKLDEKKTKQALFLPHVILMKHLFEDALLCMSENVISNDIANFG